MVLKAGLPVCEQGSDCRRVQPFNKHTTFDVSSYPLNFEPRYLMGAYE